jgi:hypothetical protein
MICRPAFGGDVFWAEETEQLRTTARKNIDRAKANPKE